MDDKNMKKYNEDDVSLVKLGNHVTFWVTGKNCL